MALQTHETDRLVLKALDQSSAGQVLQFYERNRSFLQEWEPEKQQAFYTMQYIASQLKHESYQIAKREALRLWMFKKQEESSVIGCIAFSNIIRGAFLSCHLGYKMDKDEINKGYITEALKKGIDIMFHEYGLHRIEAYIMPRNQRSLRVVEKLGFYNEGIALKYLKINGKWEDHIHMVLLNDQV